MIFLKLGGSLITHKSKPNSARLDVISRIAAEIKDARTNDPQLSVLIGHGSGSFGHPPAHRHHTHRGAHSEDDWRGFVEVWLAANLLNRIVVDAFVKADLDAISLPPSSSTISENGQIMKMHVEPIRAALDAGLLPIIQGDAGFDTIQGSTILSTETIFKFIIPQLEPSLILLAGREAGVYGDYPNSEEVLASISAKEFRKLNIRAAKDVDVTGGMASKVSDALAMCKALPGLRVRIFSGEQAGSIVRALQGEALGTLIQEDR
ncbi:MAG: isopentenyl phosphate kinase family protein [Chloroflexi bacterium]|nr:isopentenyl phosphate kinase family protein [Chloroflexota bacterium]